MATLVLRTIKGTPLTNAEVDGNFSNLNVEKTERDGTIPFTGKQTFVQSGSARASIRLPEGSADPTSPEVGDVWNNAGILRFRVAAGTTVDLITSGGNNAFTGNVEVGGDLTVEGNLVVNGTVTTINSTVVAVDDKNIELGSVAVPTNATADGGGISLKGATDKTFNWVNATTSWTSSENVDLASGRTFRINNVAVLSATALGSSVLASSLTSVGTISAGVWNGTVVGVAFGGTGVSTVASNGQILIGNGSGYTAAALTGTANQLTVTNGAGTVTLSLPNLVQSGGFGAGTAAVNNELRAAGEVTAYVTSDARLKENVTVLTNALDKVKQLSGYSFDWTAEHIANRGGEDGYFVRKRDIGVLAQEVMQVVPEAVGERDTGFLAVKYERLIPLLIEAVKELSEQVDKATVSRYLR